MYRQNYGYGHQYKPHRERGGCLWIMLILATLGGILSLFSGCMPDRESMAFMSAIFGNVPQWYFMLAGFLNFVRLICVVGLWMWQRWGFYGFVVIAVIETVVGAMVGISIIYGIIGSLIHLGIWWLVISPYWDSFE